MDNKIIWIIGAVVLVVFIMQGMDEKKISPAGAVVARTLPSKVEPLSNVVITVTASGITGDYFAIVRENIPSGWTYVSGGTLEGSQVKGIISTLTGASMSYTLKSPSGAHPSVSFSGTYQFADDPSPLTTGGQTQTSVCAAHASVLCYNNDEYYYDACNNRETRKTDCGITGDDAWQANFCQTNDVYHTRVHHVRGCSGSSCYDTTSDDTQLVTNCAWNDVLGCSGGNCMRNSGADVNADGAVTDTELLNHANLWIAGTIEDMDLLYAAGVWLGQANYPEAV